MPNANRDSCISTFHAGFRSLMYESQTADIVFLKLRVISRIDVPIPGKFVLECLAIAFQKNCNKIFQKLIILQHFCGYSGAVVCRRPARMKRVSAEQNVIFETLIDGFC